MEVTSDQVFEIIGVYFSNCYWNTIYNTALDDLRNGVFSKKEDAYRAVIEKYSKAFCAVAAKNEKMNKHYLAIVKDIYKQYKQYLSNGDTYMGFVDNVSKLLLPKGYYKTLSTRDERKDEVLRTILTKALMRFTIHITQNEIKNIVGDDRQNKQKVTEIKNKFIDILTFERNEFSNLLMAKSTGVDIKDRDEIPQIPKEVSDKLQSKIKKLIDEKNEIIRERNNYAKYVNTLKKIIEEKDKTISALQGVTAVAAVSPKKIHPRRRPIRKHKQISESETESSDDEPVVVEKNNKSLEELKTKEFTDSEYELPDADLKADE